ncbi:zinc knuckle-domain-containing protein [Stachybotrys elegans]|uniref:Zinc knuckle-domain-containing protein n=1 Tax=Stachybotrys elegans TaxID=80388 RepID=A0A8K0T3X6_9HYPO|nr:zinc knuckle-domain-containing protein [Stachybotrys elegans]
MYARRGRGGPSRSTPANVQCQKCLKRGHYSYECKASAQERPYVPRPSRTQQLLNPKLVPKLTSDTPNPLEKKKGVADEELAKMEAERARKRELEERDDELLESQAKRRRSVSSDSGAREDGGAAEKTFLTIAILLVIATVVAPHHHAGTSVRYPGIAFHPRPGVERHLTARDLPMTTGRGAPVPMMRRGVEEEMDTLTKKPQGPEGTERNLARDPLKQDMAAEDMDVEGAVAKHSVVVRETAVKGRPVLPQMSSRGNEASALLAGGWR